MTFARTVQSIDYGYLALACTLPLYNGKHKGETIMLKTHSRYNLLFIVLLVTTFYFCLPSCTQSEESKPTVNKENAMKGKELFTAKACQGCHTIGGGKLAGPDLAGVTERREIEWLTKWLTNPDEMIMTDQIAKEMLKEYYVPMPNQGLTPEEVGLLIEYMKYEDANMSSADK